MGRSSESAITFRVDGPPVAKGRHRLQRTKTGGYHIHPDRKSEVWEARAKQEAALAMRGKKPLEGPLAVVVIAVRPMLKSFSKKRREEAAEWRFPPVSRPDADNYLKAALDSCNKIVFHDDAQVVDARVIKVYGERPCLEVAVYPAHLERLLTRFQLGQLRLA